MKADTRDKLHKDQPVIRVSRVQGVRVRAQHHGRRVEVDIGGNVESLPPLAARALVRNLQDALAAAEGRPRRHQVVA